MVYRWCETYDESARVIHLWLKEFCDESLPFPEMIADAARKAAKHIEFLRKECRIAHGMVENGLGPEDMDNDI